MVMDKSSAAVVIVLVLAASFLAVRYFTPIVPPVTGQTSSFKYSAVATDTSTPVTGATSRVWYDANGDSHMTFNELGTFTETSGVYASDTEYPIGTGYDLWVQVHATNYQVTYKNVHMEGERNSDGSAKAVGTIYMIATDDSVTYDGLINKVGWDDSTDYNATTSGTSGLAEVSIVLSAADKGLSSQIWEGVSYQTIYGVQRDKDFFVKWDQITETGIPKNAILAPDFFGIYFTIADESELAPALSDFDFYYNSGVTNFYLAAFVSPTWGDLFYNTADASAPRPTVTFTVCTITSTAGTTAATYGVAIHTGLTYEQMISGAWTESLTYCLGTPGNDWDWVKHA